MKFKEINILYTLKQYILFYYILLRFVGVYLNDCQGCLIHKMK
jgi:hypothetical protein